MCQTHLDYLSNTTMSNKKHELLTLRKHICSPTVIGGARVTHGYWWGPSHPRLLVGPESPRIIGGARVTQGYWWGPCHPGLLMGPVSPRVIGGARVTRDYWWGQCHPGLLVGPVSPTVISGARVARLVFCSPTVISGARVARLVFLFCVLSLHGLYSTNYALEPRINLIIQMHGITATIFLPSF